MHQIELHTNFFHVKLRGIHIWLNFSTQGIKSIPNIMNDQNNHFKEKKKGEDEIRAYQG